MIFNKNLRIHKLENSNELNRENQNVFPLPKIQNTFEYDIDFQNTLYLWSV